MKTKLNCLTLLFSFLFFTYCRAQSDTIRVLAYNTLSFGPSSCQTPDFNGVDSLFPYLESIMEFANADIIGLDKMQCVKTSVSDVNGLSSPYFPDTIITRCMDVYSPGRYAFCPFTDLSNCIGGSSNLVFYDQNKLGYLSTTPMYWGHGGAEDFDMFKFYYRQNWFTSSTDTTFIYVILCHTISSGATDTGRDGEDSIVMNKLKTMFTHLPNIIYMGDFNARTSTEPGYEYLTQITDTNYLMDDPPFHPDGHLAYPDNWHSNTADQAYYTTTTRQTASPNGCGTTGGAKDWYDRILLSTQLVKGLNNITYLPNSYRTIGNDGHRLGISVNSGTNTSAPAAVINGLYNFSDKYPVEATLLVNPLLSVKNIQTVPGSIKANNPVSDNLVLHFASFLNGKEITMAIYDVCGRELMQTSFNVSATTINKPVSLTPGVYFLHFIADGYNTTVKVVKE